MSCCTLRGLSQNITLPAWEPCPPPEPLCWQSCNQCPAPVVPFVRRAGPQCPLYLRGTLVGQRRSCKTLGNSSGGCQGNC